MSIEETRRSMPLRYAGSCRMCGTGLPAATVAIYERDTKTVLCVECAGGAATESPNAPQPVKEDDTPATGVAGASARREHERRVAVRDKRIRENHPILGGMMLALSDEPQSTTAWATGAIGEEALGRRLDSLADRGVLALHDRRIPKSVANIDHIAVGPSGVYVIDAKNYTGRPVLRTHGGLFSPRVEELFVGSRNQTKLVSGVQKQVTVVEGVLSSLGLTGIPVTGLMCFVGSDWPLLGGDFFVDGIGVLWPTKAAKVVSKAGILDRADVEFMHRELASVLRPA